MSKRQLHELVDRLPESQAFEDEPPVEPEMLKRIDAARAKDGPGIPHEEILREFGA